jgi:hypothetical protein
MIRTLLIVLGMLALTSCSHISPVTQRQTSTSEYALSLCAIESPIHVGTVPKFRLVITNLCDQASRILNFERRPDLQHAFCRLVVTKKGRPVSVYCRITDFGTISNADWLDIPPGGSKTFVLSNFPELFEQLHSGAYEAYVEFRDPCQGQNIYISNHASFKVTGIKWW